MSWVLRKTVGSWSAGTRVEIINWPGSPQAFAVDEGKVEVQVLAGDKPIISVFESDLVERGAKKKFNKEDESE